MFNMTVKVTIDDPTMDEPTFMDICKGVVIIGKPYQHHKNVAGEAILTADIDDHDHKVSILIGDIRYPMDRIRQEKKKRNYE